jgi:acetyl-CoA carboxylase carboxyltransferase component
MTPVKAETEKLEERPPRTINEKIAELEAKREELKLGGGKDRIERQHATGKLSAR